MSNEESSHHPAGRSGAHVPGFQIRSKIGQGGTASVYLAIQESTRQPVALKIISRTPHDDRDCVRRFLRETAIVGKLAHPSIVPMMDGGTLQQHHFVAMEYLPGGSLRERIEAGERGQLLARVVCSAVASALDTMHQLGFVHRDVKPNNILFRNDGTPVLTDFGLAREIRVLRKLTAAGVAVGTPSYMSPEQIEDTKLDGRSDLYALGIVFYEVLTGRVPFEGDTLWALSEKHRNQAMPQLPARYAAYQPFLERLTAKHRGDRFTSGAEVVAALDCIEPVDEGDLSELVEEQAVLDATAREASGAARPRRTFDTTVIRRIPLDSPILSLRRWWLGIAAAAALVVIATLTWLT